MLDEILLEIRRVFCGRVLFQMENGYTRVVLGEIVDDYMRSRLEGKLNLIASEYESHVLLEDLMIRKV